MARIFISHAHADRDLVAKLVTLLKNALALRGAQDVFCSSREGAGVTPGAEIREEVVQHLTSASALIVLLTPQSVGSPWVWFEAGARMAGPTRANPLFVVPAERFKSLPNVIADLRGVSLDNPTEVHGLVSVVARHLQTTADLAAYDADVAELITTSRRKYSRFNEARHGLARWVTAYAMPLVVLAIGVVIALAVRVVQTKSATAEAATDEAVVKANATRASAAAQYLKWRGQLLSSGSPPGGSPLAVPLPCAESTERLPGQAPIVGAVVLAWRSDADAKADRDSCRTPQCTSNTTSSDGRFEIDLTNINVNKGDSIVLLIKPPKHDWVSCRMDINVNAEGRTNPVANPLQRLTVTPGVAGPATAPNVGIH
jgi:hypothetical protein